MAHLLVSDTSVLIDLERGSLLQATFQLPTPLAVPDLRGRTRTGAHERGTPAGASGCESFHWMRLGPRSPRRIASEFGHSDCRMHSLLRSRSREATRLSAVIDDYATSPTQKASPVTVCCGCSTRFSTPEFAPSPNSQMH